MYALRSKDKHFSQNREMTQPLKSLIEDKTGKALTKKDKHIDLTIMFVDEADLETIITNIPTVRIIYHK